MARQDSQVAAAPVHAEALLSAFMATDAFDEVRRVIDLGRVAVQGPERLRSVLLPAMVAEASGARGSDASDATTRQFLVITATSREAEVLARALRTYLPVADVLELPAWETLPHERLSPSPQVVGQRLDVLRRLHQAAHTPSAAGGAGEPGAGLPADSGPQAIVASVRAALQPVADNLGAIQPIDLQVGSDAPLDDLGRRLVELAYARVDLVTRRGEFAVRGGILDVFPPTADYPYRVEFFGDQVDQIKPFHVADQRTAGETVGSVRIGASRELLLTDEVRQRAAEMQHEFPNLAAMLEKLSEGIPVEGMESLAPALAGTMVPITDYLRDDAVVAVVAPERVRTRADSLVKTNQEFLDAAWKAAVAGAEAPIDLSAGGYVTVDDLRVAAAARPWWELTPFDDGTSALVRVEASPVPSFAGTMDGAIGHVRELTAAGWSVAVAVAAGGTAARVAQLLADAGVPAAVAQDDGWALEPGSVRIMVAGLDEGWEIEEAKLALLSEADFFGRAATYAQGAPRKLASRRRNTVDPLQLKPGDLVVHEQHGIGRFVDLMRREVGAGKDRHLREYLVIEYAPSKRGHPPDRLSVPTDQLDQLTRYVGSDSPQLSKMGGSDWARTKSKARKAVREIAVGLVKLYAERANAKGHAFGPDTPWQRELEEAFPYAETPDQLQTIDEVKRDMERPMPMDRLLAGDVGFGKTEVAVRAAFKAIQDGMQVVMLVPTTLLVQQHLETFSERYAGFPVKLRGLSRFQSASEIAETVAGLADGSVDMVIGTHRVLSKGVAFKNLGLVIIDEEQRFGVEHKERLKELKTNVDVLAMSATPIPRTLEMAVSGIREMSTLATPPESRHPVLTYVGAYSDGQVAAAVRRELLREGQVFYVHNRVSDIARVATHLAELVPEARIAVAHGQMGEAELERVIVDFWERKYDVLVSTTIVETGMDVQNANTLIVDDAQRYGLAQLHQLRGRVGRGRERAYAYLLYPSEKPLGEVAQDRLETIAANNELGAGMQVAMKDLELRGAGNLLGADQSGHIAGVGFDLYLRMIGDAVNTFKGEHTAERVELRLELPIDAHIPDDYVNSERLRLEAYQKLANAAGPSGRPGAIEDVAAELTDRYGEPPERVMNLLAMSRLRRRLVGSGLSEVVAMGPVLRVKPVELSDSLQIRLRRLYPGAKMLPQGNTLTVPVPRELLVDAPAPLAGVPEGESLGHPLVDWVLRLLRAIEVVPGA